MSEQITWTHVDKLTSKMLDERGMMHVGNTDPEVTYNLLQFLDSRLKAFQRDADLQEQRCDRLEVELMKLRNAPKSRTKARLTALEEAVAKLQEQPSHNFVPALIEGLLKARCCDRFPGCMCGMGADGL